MIIQLKVRPHPYFKREGQDIYTDVAISLADVSFIFLFIYLGCPRSRSICENTLWRHKNKGKCKNDKIIKNDDIKVDKMYDKFNDKDELFVPFDVRLDVS